MPEYILENWYLVDGKDPFTAPEQIKMKVCGEVYNHPNFEDGSPVETPIIKDARENLVICNDGNYILGNADPQYREWYREQYGRELNQKAPFGAG